MTDIFSQMEETGLVPVIQIDSAEDAVPLARALLAGGVNIAEVTFRTEAAEGSIRRITLECPKMTVFAGTVLTLEQAKKALRAGAKAIVSPGYDDQIVDWCMKKNATVIPGVSTASEVQHAVKKGLSVLKFFPAEACGGTKFLNAIRGPFAKVRFMPTGGISEENFTAYAKLKNVIAVSGSWLCTKENIGLKEWDKITEACKKSQREFPRS